MDVRTEVIRFHIVVERSVDGEKITSQNWEFAFNVPLDSKALMSDLRPLLHIRGMDLGALIGEKLVTLYQVGIPEESRK